MGEMTGIPIKTFTWKDLVGRKVYISSARSGDLEVLAAHDLETDEMFILQEIDHK